MSEQLKIPRLVTFIGMAKSGKTELAGYLSEKYGYQHIRPSAVIHKELVKKYGERLFSRSEYRDMGKTLREARGSTFYLDEFSEGTEKLVIDGPRHLSTLVSLRNKNVIPIGIVATADVRFGRAERSNEKIGALTLEEFIKEELPEMNSPSESGGQLIPMLWSIDPADIIDTSCQALLDSQHRIDEIILRHSSS